MPRRAHPIIHVLIAKPTPREHGRTKTHSGGPRGRRGSQGSTIGGFVPIPHVASRGNSVLAGTSIFSSFFLLYLSLFPFLPPSHRPGSLFRWWC